VPLILAVALMSIRITLHGLLGCYPLRNARLLAFHASSWAISLTKNGPIDCIHRYVWLIFRFSLIALETMLEYCPQCLREEKRHGKWLPIFL
jgi:hypothetical protein